MQRGYVVTTEDDPDELIYAGFSKETAKTFIENFEKYLGGYDIARWTDPRGGYFISMYVEPGCAKRVHQLARSAGVTLTPAGATYPYGRDPDDSNIRIAPTFPEVSELKEISKILCTCIKIAAAEKYLGIR